MIENPAKPQRQQSAAFSLIYAAVLPKLQAVAREHGYALAVHGSMATDMDLIAVPWIDNAADAYTLVEAIRHSFNGYIRDETQWDHNPAVRPHGRLVWSIYPSVDSTFGVGPYLDVSVMPKGAGATVEAGGG